MAPANKPTGESRAFDRQWHNEADSSLNVGEINTPHLASQELLYKYREGGGGRERERENGTENHHPGTKPVVKRSYNLHVTSAEIFVSREIENRLQLCPPSK